MQSGVPFHLHKGGLTVGGGAAWLASPTRELPQALCGPRPGNTAGWSRDARGFAVPAPTAASTGRGLHVPLS